MDRLSTAKGLLGDLVAFPTVSSDSNLALIDWAAEALRRAGARAEIVPDETDTKANLFATFGPEADGGIVLSGHTDVVPVEGQPWSSDPFTMVERAGRLYGRGTCDMKGFIACILAVAPEMARWRLGRPIHVALTYDEEVGCFGAASLAAFLGRREIRPAIALIGEPTSMRLVEGHKGCFEYTTEVRGLEGHGSAPDSGVNAADYASRYASRLLELSHDLRGRAPADSPFSPPWTTLNIGRMSAGSARNVIAGHAEIEWEMRPVTQEDADFVRAEIDRFAAEALIPRMRATHPEAGITRHVVAEVAGLQPKPGNPASALAAALTGRNDTELVAFGTEAGVFQKIGIDCVVCGPGSIAQAHKPEEFVELSQLALCLDMLGRLEREVG